MLLIEEKGMILAVGGDDGQGNMLDTCEAFSFSDNQWRTLNQMN